VPDGDIVLDELGVAEHQRTFFVLAFSRWLPAATSRADGVMRILCGSRANWRAPFPPGMSMQDNKGTDVLVNGVAELMRSVPDARIELHLIEKGLHVAETRALIADAGLEATVRWHPELLLRDFLAAVAQADVVVDHFGPAIPGLCAWNGMAAGKPVLGNLCLDVMEPHFGERVPACHADTPAGVARWLARLWREPQFCKEIGSRARAFAERHLSAPRQLDDLLRAALS
jgi:glycosyltransferase involved in cell wall biosynthesis